MKIPEEEIEKAKDFFVKFVSEGKDKIVNEILIKMYKETKRIGVEESERGFIDFLYWKENKSLRKIGELFGLSQEGVRWKMIKYNIKRRKTGWPAYNKGWVKFKSLEEYFEYVKETGKESILYLHKFINPIKKLKGCEVCGGKRYLRLHYLKKPATSMEDIQVLCITCFYSNIRGGINNFVRDEICKKYQQGKLVTELAEEYKVTAGNISQILKIRNIKTRKKSSKYSLAEKLRIIKGIERNGEKYLVDSIAKFGISSPTYYAWRKELIEKRILTKWAKGR